MRVASAAALALVVLLSAPPAAEAGKPDLRVHADFPGGSVDVDEIDQPARRIRFRPAQHPQRGWRCWWYFRVTGIEPGETLVLEASGMAFALPDWASISLDGETWRFTKPGRRTAGKTAYEVRVDAPEAYFAWGPPYLPSHAASLLEATAKACPGARSFTLCRTREDRPVLALHVSQDGPSPGEKAAVWIQARQHAWEAGSSWVCQGLVEWLTSADPRAERLRTKARFTIVPIMDVDNVVRGAGGKDQTPQDHNRDWSDAPHWRSVAATQQALRRISDEGPFALFVDLHNPGPRDRQPFFYVCPRDGLAEARREVLDAFLAAARAEMTGPLSFQGHTRESGANYDPNWQHMAKNWVAQHTAAAVAVTLEVPWNTPYSTRTNYRRLGRRLGMAIERHLQPRNPVAE